MKIEAGTVETRPTFICLDHPTDALAINRAAGSSAAFDLTVTSPLNGYTNYNC